MKKILTVLALAVAFLLPETAKSQVSFNGEVLAGYNVSGVTHMKSRMGFRAGVLGQMNFDAVPGLYANTGLMLELKGAKTKHDLPGVDAQARMDAYYFTIPIHLGYQYNFNDQVGVFGEFGPYFGIGSFGKTTAKVNGHKVIDADTFGDEGLADRFDFGLGIRIGVEFIQRIPVSFGWDWGLVDISKSHPELPVLSGESYHNYNFSFNVGYKF